MSTGSEEVKTIAYWWCSSLSQFLIRSISTDTSDLLPFNRHYRPGSFHQSTTERRNRPYSEEGERGYSGSSDFSWRLARRHALDSDLLAQEPSSSSVPNDPFCPDPGF